MAEGKGIPWKGKAKEQGGSRAATDPNYQALTPPRPARSTDQAGAPAELASRPSLRPAGAPAVETRESATTEPAPLKPAGGAGGKGIPWKGKAAAQGGSSAATDPNAARPTAPAPRAVATASSTPRPAPAAPRPAAAAAPAAAAPKPAGPTVVVEGLLRALPDLGHEMRHGYAEINLAPEQLLHVARVALVEFGYDYLSAVTAVDWQDRFELLYHLYGYDPRQAPGCLVLRVSLPHEAHPLVPSVTAIWPGADFQEREIYDLLGIKFLGHPDLRRILLSDDFPGHPLRKDFVFDYDYVLVKHLRSGAEGQLEEPYTPPHLRAANGGPG